MSVLRPLVTYLERLLFVLGYHRRGIPAANPTQLMYIKRDTKVSGGTSMIPLQIDWNTPASEAEVLATQHQLDLAGVLPADQFMARLEAASNDVKRVHRVRVPSQDSRIRNIADFRAMALGLEIGEHHELSCPDDGVDTMPTLVLEYFADPRWKSDQVRDFEMQIYHAVGQEPGADSGIAVHIRRKDPT